jgi:hypothetical protein
MQPSSAAHERSGATSGADPLAELARLIGQDDLFKQMRVDAARAGSEETYVPPAQPARDRLERGPSPLREMAAARQDLYAEPEEIEQYARDYAPPPRGAPIAQADHAPDYYPPGRASDHRYAPPSLEPATYGKDQYAQAGYASDPVSEYPEWDRADRQEPEYASAEQETFDDVAPRDKRRGGMIIVVGVVGVALIGTAGAFAYRAMTGGGEGAQPPVIKAEQGPAKVTPPASTGAATGTARTTYDRAGGGKDVNLVPREEQPVEIKDARSSGPKLIGPTGAGPGLSGAPAGSGATASVPLTAPNPNEPKKVKTFAIRPDGSVAPEPTGNRAQPSSGNTNRPGTPAQPNRAPGARPGPQSQADEPARPPAAVPVRTASIPSAANPLPAMPAAPATGNFVVQLTSQKTENDAQSSFRALQAKYPSVLAGRQPVIRRADLGDRGTYYRAQVGPFQTAEQANDLCGNLKAAGGQCIVQRN